MSKPVLNFRETTYYTVDYETWKDNRNRESTHDMTEEQLEKLWSAMVKEHSSRLGENDGSDRHGNNDGSYLELEWSCADDAWDIWNACEIVVTDIEELAEAKISKPEEKKVDWNAVIEETLTPEVIKTVKAESDATMLENELTRFKAKVACLMAENKALKEYIEKIEE